MTRLWIDDVRKDPDTEWEGIVEPDGDWVWVKTVKQAIAWLSEHKDEEIELISFDHDLGFVKDDETGEETIHEEARSWSEDEWTSRPILLWMIENNVWPHKIVVHSHNPYGAEWLGGMAEQYGPSDMPVAIVRY